MTKRVHDRAAPSTEVEPPQRESKARLRCRLAAGTATTGNPFAPAQLALHAPRIVSGTLRVHIMAYAGTGRVPVRPARGAATRRCHAGGASPATRVLRGGRTRHRDRR